MNLFRRNYDFASFFVMLSGLLYALTFLVNGWGSLSKTLLVIGIIFLVIGFLLRKRLRWLAYFAYVFMLISLLVTMVAFGTSSVGAWWWVLAMVTQVLAIYKLFRILWAPKPEANI